MSTPDEERFQRLVEDVADGRDVDWNAWEFGDPGLRARARRLRLLQEMSRHGASAAPAAGDPAAGDPAAGDPEDLPTLFSWGPLNVLECLSETPSGAVYRARDTTLRRDVALKLLRPDASLEASEARFLEEARRLAGVRHPNVLVVHGAASYEGRAGIWTDLLDGITLEQRLARHGPLGASEAAVIGIDLCRALSAVHAAGLTHGDVKTTNVMREEGGRIVLLDFSSEPETTGVPGVVRGSPLYALGVLLFRLVTAGYPVEAADVDALIALHAAGGRLRLLDVRPDLPVPFVRAVERALEPDPARRFATTGELEAALSRTLGETGPHVEQTGASRSRSLGRAAVFVAVAGLATAAVMFWRAQTGPGALRVEAALFRQAGAGAEPLVSGDRVSPGDQLFLEISGDRAVHVYVIDEDSEGRAFVLFPAPGVEPRNPLAPGRHRLPGATEGRLRTWEVDSAGGEEVLLLIASDRALPELEEEIRAIPRVETDADPAPAAGDPRRLRGIGRLGAPPPDEERPPRLSDRLRATWDPDSGVWFREIRLRNPGA